MLLRALRVITAMLILCTAWQLASAEDGSSIALDVNYQHYFLPSEDDIDLPVASLYWNDILFEARYNYEGSDAASFWLGYAFAFGESWEFELTPMIGSVVGSMHGIAPGLKADVSWRFLNLYSEMEYFFDYDTRENNFFYSWSEITAGLTEWLRVGIVGNRTRLYDSSVELDRGPTVAFEFDRVTLSCSALNIDSDVFVVLGVNVSFGGGMTL